MSEAKHPEPEYYETFNDFFTRELKQGARTIIEGDANLATPVDGKVSQQGDIKEGRIFQAYLLTFLYLLYFLYFTYLPEKTGSGTKCGR